MQVINVPPKAEFDNAGSDFREFSLGLTDATAVLDGIAIEPGAFSEADALEKHVTEFCRVRKQTLQLYAEVSEVMAEVIAMVGEEYTIGERNRADSIADLSTRMGSKLKELDTLRKALTDIKAGQPVTIPRRKPDVPVIVIPDPDQPKVFPDPNTHHTERGRRTPGFTEIDSRTLNHWTGDPSVSLRRPRVEGAPENPDWADVHVKDLAQGQDQGDPSVSRRRPPVELAQEHWLPVSRK